MRTNRISNALVAAGLFVVVATTATWAGTFTNWPTYASSASTSWPKASEYKELIQDLTWSHRALVERSEVVGKATTGIAPKTDGVRLPKTDIERMKDQVELLIPEYVADGQVGSFTNLSEFPVMTETGVMAELSLPVDFLDSMPYSRHLNNVLPAGVTTNYGMPGLKNSILELKWTGRLCRNAHQANHTANRYGRGFKCSREGHKHSSWTAARSCEETAYAAGWQENQPYFGEEFYYQLRRGLGYTSYGNVGWNAVGHRRRSTPQCPGIAVPDGASFSWVAYLEPLHVYNGSSVSYDGYSGWVKDKLAEWDSGGPTSTNTVQAETIGGQDETFPFYLNPELVNTNRTTHGVQIEVREFHWLLKWDFQYDE